MLGQTAEAKMEMFVDTMPTIIQTHLIICENWAKTTIKAKELEHIIRKCDPPAALLPTLTQGAVVTGLYSHIAHSDDKEETDIPQPFKEVKPKQTKNSGGGKGKKQQQMPKPSPVKLQEEQYTYEDTSNYYHNENYRGQSRDHRPYRGQTNGQFFRGQNSCGRGQCNQNPYQGQYQSKNYQCNNYQCTHGQYNNPCRGYHQGNNYGQFRGGSHGHGRVNYHGHGCGRSNYRGNNNYQCHQYYDHDNDYQPDQYGPPCALCGGYNHTLNIVLRENMTLTT